MAKEALLKIQEAEVKAQALIKDAEVKADQIIENAKAEIAKESSKIAEQGKQKIQDEKKEAEKNAGIQSEEFAKQTEALCDTFRQKMLLLRPKAVDSVIQMVKE